MASFFNKYASALSYTTYAGVGLLAMLPAVCVGLRLAIGKPKKCTCTRQMKGQTIIVTGATSGIGAEVTLELTRRGATVVLAARSEQKAESLMSQIRDVIPSADVHFVHLDLSSFHSVRSFVNSFKEKFKQLDVLINNAAYQGQNYPTEDGVMAVFGINYLAHVLLTFYMLVQHREATDTEERQPLRVINVVSGSYTQNEIDFGDVTFANRTGSIYRTYGESKLALLLFSLQLAKTSPGVISIAVHPGAVNTDLMRHWTGLAGFALRLLANLTFRSPKEGAQTIIHCACVQNASKFNGQFVMDHNVVELKHKNNNDEDLNKLHELTQKIISTYA